MPQTQFVQVAETSAPLGYWKEPPNVSCTCHTHSGVGGPARTCSAKLFPPATDARHFIVTRLLLSTLHSEMENWKMSILASAILRCRVFVAALEAAKKSKIACKAVTDFAAVRGGYFIG